MNVYAKVHGGLDPQWGFILPDNITIHFYGNPGSYLYNVVDFYNLPIENTIKVNPGQYIFDVKFTRDSTNTAHNFSYIVKDLDKVDSDNINLYAIQSSTYNGFYSDIYGIQDNIRNDNYFLSNLCSNLLKQFPLQQIILHVSSCLCISELKYMCDVLHKSFIQNSKKNVFINNYLDRDAFIETIKTYFSEFPLHNLPYGYKAIIWDNSLLFLKGDPIYTAIKNALEHKNIDSIIKPIIIEELQPYNYAKYKYNFVITDYAKDDTTYVVGGEALYDNNENTYTSKHTPLGKHIGYTVIIYENIKIDNSILHSKISLNGKVGSTFEGFTINTNISNEFFEYSGKKYEKNKKDIIKISYQYICDIHQITKYTNINKCNVGILGCIKGLSVWKIDNLEQLEKTQLEIKKKVTSKIDEIERKYSIGENNNVKVLK